MMLISCNILLVLKYVLEIKEHCNEHHEKFSLYCKEHECPCCRTCNVDNRKDCKEVTVLENITKNVSICFTAVKVCRADTYFYMLTIFFLYSLSFLI
jgi:hypothetical protein